MGWVADCSDDPPTGELYRSQIAGENNRSHSLSAQILASRLMGLDLGQFDDGLQSL